MIKDTINSENYLLGILHIRRYFFIFYIDSLVYLSHHFIPRLPVLLPLVACT